MGTVIIVAVVIVVVVLAVGVVLMQRKRTAGTAPAPEPSPAPRPPRPEPAPMTGLEEALNKATDRAGHTMADRLDAESDHVERLRDTDDTGPLLRRALDSVDRGPEAPARDHAAGPDAGATADDSPGADRPGPA